MQDRKPQDQDKFIVRLPDGMRDRIKAAADANNRSMNAEIVSTLEEKYPEPILPILTPQQMVEFFDQILSGLTPEDEAFDPIAFKKYVEETTELRDRYAQKAHDADQARHDGHPSRRK